MAGALCLQISSGRGLSPSPSSGWRRPRLSAGKVTAGGTQISDAPRASEEPPQGRTLTEVPGPDPSPFLIQRRLQMQLPPWVLGPCPQQAGVEEAQGSPLLPDSGTPWESPALP